MSTTAAVEAIDLVKHCRGLRIANVVGGMPYQLQIARLQNANLVVATPGRLLDLIDQRAAELAALWSQAPYDSVAVTNEVGWGLVSEHRSGRIFADRLGWLNQRIASASDRVDLVVSGQVLTIKEPA